MQPAESFDAAASPRKKSSSAIAASPARPASHKMRVIPATRFGNPASSCLALFLRTRIESGGFASPPHDGFAVSFVLGAFPLVLHTFARSTRGEQRRGSPSPRSRGSRQQQASSPKPNRLPRTGGVENAFDHEGRRAGTGHADGGRAGGSGSVEPDGGTGGHRTAHETDRDTRGGRVARPELQERAPGARGD